MKIRFIFLAGVFTIASALHTTAQTTVNNPGFETWDNLGTSDEEPQQWNSFKSAQGTWSGVGAQQVLRSAVKRPGSAGTYSAVIWCRDASLAIANGNLTCGRINMGSTIPSSTNNYNLTLTSNTAYNEAFTGHPDSLVVWVKSIIANSAHQPRIHAVIHDNYDLRDPINSGSATHVVGEATLNFTTTGGVWIRKSIPFIYNGPSTTPNYILISFTTCKDPGTGTPGDSLYIDDVEFVYNPVLTTGAISPSAYLVSTSMSAPVSIPFTLTGTMHAGNIVTAQLSDASGSFASPVVLGILATTTSGTISGTIPAGTPTGGGYRIRVVSSDYALTAADNGSDIVISDVTASPEAFNQGSVSVFFNGNSLVAKLQNTGINGARLCLYSISGSLLNVYELHDNTENNFLPSVPAGLYIYTISAPGGTISGKVIRY